MSWSYAVIECYCGRKWEDEKPHPEKPKGCPVHPNGDCIGCRHFAYADVTNKKYIKAISKIDKKAFREAKKSG